ncbi:hypothetical protein ACET3Z_032542 [Daucus carota]
MISLAGDDEKVDKILFGLQKISSTISKSIGTESGHEVSHRADKFVSPSKCNEIIVQNSDICRNKGCGSRIKSNRELSQQIKKKKKRSAAIVDNLYGIIHIHV